MPSSTDGAFVCRLPYSRARARRAPVPDLPHLGSRLRHFSRLTLLCRGQTHRNCKSSCTTGGQGFRGPRSRREHSDTVAASVPLGGAQRGSTWSGCRAALIADGGSLSGLRNPFDDRQPLFSRQCDRANPATRGAVVVEKGQAPITGAPTVYSPIEDSEPLVRGLMLRIIACDKGSFSTRVKELKL